VPSVLGFGRYLPERVVRSEELAERLGVTPEWVFSACGIEERRWAAPGETVVDLAEAASRALLGRLGLAPGEIGALLVGSGTPERVFPGVSADLARRLGLGPVFALDVPLASSGGLVALALALDLAPRHGPTLVVGAEKMSAVIERDFRKETAILFGDGAGACLVVPGDGPLRLVDARVTTEGAFADALCIAPGGALMMDGRTVILQAVRQLPRTVRELLAAHGRVPSDVDLFVFHQANLNLLERVAAALQVERERVFVNVARRGNTSAASLLIAAAEAEEAGRFNGASNVVLAAFGAGFSCGAALLEASHGVTRAARP
jgi:3-oxoacyl-[acyl-carrier-protein] synthase-3